jgi:hypothetical protein
VHDAQPRLFLVGQVRAVPPHHRGKPGDVPDGLLRVEVDDGGLRAGDARDGFDLAREVVGGWAEGREADGGGGDGAEGGEGGYCGEPAG